MWLFVFLMITTSCFFFFNFIHFYWALLPVFNFFFINTKNDLILDFKNPRKAHFILTLNFSLVSVPLNKIHEKKSRYHFDHFVKRGKAN